MFGNGFNCSAPRFLESGRPSHSDADRPRSLRSGHRGQHPQVHCAPYFDSGAEAARPTAPSARIQDTRQVPGALKFHASTEDAFHSTGAADAGSVLWPGQDQSGGGGRERGFQAKDYSPTASDVLDGNKPAALCGDYTQDKPSVKNDDTPGSERRAEETRGPEDGGIARLCAEEKKTAAVTGTAGCEYVGCSRTPKYGTKEGLLSFCKDHKRKGMYTIRNGVVLLATRDGTAFRQAGSGPSVQADNATAESTQAPHDGAELLEAPAPAASDVLHQEANARPSKNLEVTSRKKCEIPDCNVQPSYGTAGTTRPRFCSRHKEKGHVCLKNRPCLFQGCDTRPHYGLPGGRGVFCVAHKKEGMIHLLNETNNAKKEEAARKRREARTAEVNGRSIGYPNLDEDGEGEWEEQHQKRQNRKSAAREGKSSSGAIATVAGKRGTKANKRRKICVGTTGSSPPYRTEDGSELAPSDEMRLLLEARESTRAAGEADNSGRRPRIPSRKFLEASGKVADEGAQWMTKEKREEQARNKRELKAQKKAAAAAGLQVGQVLETAALRLASGANRSGGALGDGGRAASTVFWRKLSPAEILRVAGKQPAIEGAQPYNAKAADAPGVVAASNSKQEERASIEAASVSETDIMSGKKEKHVAEAADGPAAPHSSTVAEIAHESRPKRSRKGRDEGPGEGEKGAAKATCEFENCPKKASFGVNGVVRYCKMHRIFGMHKIDGRTQAKPNASRTLNDASDAMGGCV